MKIILHIILAGSTIFYSCSSKTVEKDPTPVINNTENGVVSFTKAARLVTPGVVHIKTSYETRSRAGRFFGEEKNRSVQSMESGSGVVISADGYIVTNFHVIEDASEIEVVFPDRRSYTATLVGQDSNTDLALLKIEAKQLPFIRFGNSDSVEVGEPVLAIGYPLSLNTTVTAGIVSAKGRNIGIIGTTDEGDQVNTAVESFIQTDAAINSGNSGGALVNINGELIGINTAIASQTGSYSGYAFAVPVNLASKIIDDLKAYGKVRRGLLGVSFPSPSYEDQYMKEQGINPGTVQGVFITSVQPGSAAEQSGLQEGDIIQSIDTVPLFSSAQFSELLARHRPGETIQLQYLRDNKTVRVHAILKEESENPVAKDPKLLQRIYDKMGAELASLTPALKQRYDLEAGVIVTTVEPGGFFHKLGIPKGTIIAYVNGQLVSNPEDIDKALIAAQNTSVQILGVAPDGSRIAFAFSLGA